MASRSPLPIDPGDPRAPSAAIWAELTAEERAALVEQLPAEVPWELLPPEGDPHRLAKERALEALNAFFRKLGRRVYLTSDLSVYYPDEPRFAPDLFAVLDVEACEREKWVVSEEGRGLDFVLEVLYRGHAKKDLEDNVARYARLGIPEYFVFDRGRGRLHGFSLAPDARTYQPIVPQQARWSSRVLGLELSLESERVRFHFGTAPLLEFQELALRAETLLLDTIQRKDALELLLATEREQAQQARERAEREVAELKARLAQLQAKPGPSGGNSE